MDSLGGFNSDFEDNIVLGLFQGTGVGSLVRRVVGIGNASLGAISAPSFADVWTGAGTYPFITSPTTLEVVSASANDTVAGTGARTVLVTGLNSSFVEISATASLNGTTAVALSGSFYRVNSVLITGAGSGLTNAGQITVRDTGGGTTRGIIPVGIGISQQSIYTVPAGHTLLIKNLEMEINSSAGGGGSSKGADCTFYFGFPAATNPFYRIPRRMTCTDIQPYLLPAATRIPIAEKTDFMMRCLYTSGALSLTAAWEGHLYRVIP